MSGVRSQALDFQKLSAHEYQENWKEARPSAPSTFEAWRDNSLRSGSWEAYGQTEPFQSEGDRKGMRTVWESLSRNQGPGSVIVRGIISIYGI